MPRKFEVKPAEREKLKLSAMFMGATGSGKTVGALITAKGMVEAMYPELDNTSKEFWEKIGLIDTEHSRAKIYADAEVGGNYIGHFLHIDFEPPYDVESYMEAVTTLKGLGCEVIIIDSATHAWDNAGGILELHQNMGGQFATWSKVNPIIKKFYQALTADTDVHIITTIRSKIKYEASQTETGKMKVSKIGLKPIMRDDFEYEVLVALHFDEDHLVTAVKDNTHIFEDDELIIPRYGTELLQFLNEGVDVNSQRKLRHKALVEEIEEVYNQNLDNKELLALFRTVETQANRKFGVLRWQDLPYSSLEKVLEKIRGTLNVEA